MAAYRFSWYRPDGWTRLGMAGAVAVIFLTPMLWSLGVFGEGDETMKRALIFGFAGLWFFVGFGYMLGWAVRGFLVRIKDPGEDEDGHRPTGPAHPPAGAHPPPHRPGH